VVAIQALPFDAPEAKQLLPAIHTALLELPFHASLDNEEKP
jgi:hypothetical protein